MLIPIVNAPQDALDEARSAAKKGSMTSFYANLLDQRAGGPGASSDAAGVHMFDPLFMGWVGRGPYR